MSQVPPPPPPPSRATRQGRAAPQIRGPQSALTDFLASHNISAIRIREEADERRAAAIAAARAAAAATEQPEASSSAAPAPRRRLETKTQENKRKKEQEKSIAKIKASKKFLREKAKYDFSSGEEDEWALRELTSSNVKAPGQMDNCDICDKRFTVTGYSRAGPNGGLLCPACSKGLDREEGGAKKKQKTAAGQRRRQVQSNLLDGIYPGAKRLATLCIETLANNVDKADDFGEQTPELVDKLAAILSKRRLLNPKTLNLFLRPGSEILTVYDGAKLSSDDYIRIFQIMPTVRHLRVRNAVQFKNQVIDHLLGTTVALQSFSIHGANLIDDERWDRYLNEKGSHLTSLKVYHTDGHFGDAQIQLLSVSCPNIERLKISHNQKVTDDGILNIRNLINLQHLSLEIYKTTTSPPYVEVLNRIGGQLKTLSLATVPQLDDSILEAIHEECKQISKLRITDNETMTDGGFARLFKGWDNPPLTYVDLHKCRHIDSGMPRENVDKIGLCSEGFEALMAHSGPLIKHLNINSCRHISLEAFEKAFGPGTEYPELTEMNISFCHNVNDFVVASIFRVCPKLKTLKVFGNISVKDVKVPKGRILIGMPNAMGMQIEGADDEGRTI